MSQQEPIYHRFPETMNEKEIYDFMYGLFEMYEIRARVGSVNNMTFEVRTKENGHNIPHVHANYNNMNISISLLDFKVLAGSLPSKNQSIAVQWVKNNAEMLKERWNDYHVFEFPVFGKSMLE